MMVSLSILVDDAVACRRPRLCIALLEHCRVCRRRARGLVDDAAVARSLRELASVLPPTVALLGEPIDVAVCLFSMFEKKEGCHEYN
jgi:hypothetical protein